MKVFKNIYSISLTAIGSILFSILISSGPFAADGKKVFKKCKACHSFSKNKIGPNLKGIIDRKAGNVEGYKYSKGMKAASNAGLIWSVAELDNFLKKPKTFMKNGGWGKTKMSFSGLKKEKDRQAVIEYIKNQ